MQFLDQLPGTRRQSRLLAACLAITLTTVGLVGGAPFARAAGSLRTSKIINPPNVAKLAITGARLPGMGDDPHGASALPEAVVGQPYSYHFKLAGGGAASWAPLTELPLGLTLDPDTGVLSGVPQQAGTDDLAVSAARAGAHPAIGSKNTALTIKPAANGAPTSSAQATPAFAGGLAWRHGAKDPRNLFQ